MKKIFSLITALVLCTAMWGGEPKVSQTLYKVEGALYQGLNEKFTGGTKIFVPNDSAAVFTSFDGQPADWYRSNKLQEGGEGTPSFTFQKGFGDYAPIQIRNYTGYGQNATKTKIDYIYGKAAYNGTALSVGISTMNMMSMANGYYFRTEDSASTGDIGKCYADNKTANTYKSNSTYGTYMMYGNDFTHSTHGAVQAYEMVLDNPGEMYIDYVILPIFGYPKDNTATIDKMIPEGKTVTLELYALSAISKNADGKYSYTKESAPVATMTVDNKAYTKDATSGYSYRGTLKFDLEDPVLLTTSFVARLTWDDGCNFGLITDYYNLQNYTTWYIFNDGKYYMWSGGGCNSSISYHATFPTLDKKDTKTALEFTYEGGSDEVAIMSNIDPADTDEFTIDLGGADEWITMTGITYSGGTYKKSGTNTLTFAAEANEGEAREATITLKHHGKELTYTVSQEAAPAPVLKTIYCKMEQGWWKNDGAAVGCHSWGTGEGTTWPGVRMTPVEGQADLWSIELDLNKVQNVIFTRVNATGEIADWGAKTKDLTIPVDDKDLFTITTSEAVWGDPGCEGEWSKYEAPVVKPAVTKIEIEGDMSVAGSELTFWVTVAGFSAEPMVTFEVKAGEGEYEQLQRNKFTPTATGDYTIKATAIYRNDEKGINEEAYKEVEFTIGTPAAGITVNVTVPAGTPACYFYGEMSNNTFVEMDKVDDTHYTTSFPEATTIGWGYKFCWENGNWATNNSDPAGDIKVEPVNGVIDVEVKAWATNPGTEYKYTTYTEWQLKYGPAWEWVNTTKQEDGTFTVEAVWGNTGINIASGENPIKQDWYPLDDEALTVEEDVAEGDNVVISLTVVNDETVALEVAKAAAPAEVLPQITEAPKSWAGEYVITTMKDDNTALVWTGIDAGQCRVEASVEDKKLTNNDFVKVIVEALQEGGYSIKVKGGTNDGKYITQGATPAYKNALAFVNQPVRVDIAMNDKGLVDIYQVINEEQTMYLLYNATAGATNERFRFYKGSNYGQSNYYSLTLFGTPAPQPVGTFDLTIVQDTVWSKDGAKVAAWIWGEELAGQWTSWATNTNDTLTLKVDERADSIILVRNSPEASEPTWEAWNRIDAGEIDDCHLFIITNWNEGVWCERPVVETTYYAKNNWDGGEWSWLEMSATDQENIYMLDSVVFGGTGVNINDKEEDATAIWFAVDEISVLVANDGFPGPIPPDPRKRDTLIWAPARTSVVLEAPQLLAGDTIKLFFNAADSTLKAFIIGRPEQPQPVGTFDLTIVQDTVWSKDNAKVAAWIWGEELAGQWTSWATNTNDTLTLKVDERADSIILVRNSPEASEPTWEAWNRIDAGEIDACHLFIITNWNEGVWCERPATPDYGLLVNGTDYLAGTPEDKDTYTEYAVNKQLAVGEFVQLYDNVNKVAWTVTPDGQGFTDFDIHDNAYYIKQMGSYQFYIKIPKQGMESALYVGFQGAGTNLNNLKAQDGKRYNILGQPVNETYHGIVIMNGQTYLQ